MKINRINNNNESTKKLSILICTLQSRSHFLTRLLSVLKPMLTQDVQICIASDNGQIKIGQKRNKLLQFSKGTYIAFVDDDDLVDQQYVSLILAATIRYPDCVGIMGHISIDNGPVKLFIHSLDIKSWYEKDGVYYRNPNHLNPVKRQIALSVMFPIKNHGQDFQYSTNLLKHLSTQILISKPIYKYLYVSKSAQVKE